MFELIVISDLHLGCDECKRDDIIEFLETHESELWVINGDLIHSLDLRQFTKKDMQIIKLLRQKNEDTCMIGILGNHESHKAKLKPEPHILKNLLKGLLPIPWREEFIYDMHGKRFMFNHGHQYFAPTKWSTAVYRAYKAMRSYNKDYANWILRNLIIMSSNIDEDFCARNARKDAAGMGIDIVVCGHTHIGSVTLKEDIVYANSGTWTELSNREVSTFLGIKDGALTLFNKNDIPLEHYFF